jgi:hypothetical protein
MLCEPSSRHLRRSEVWQVDTSYHRLGGPQEGLQRADPGCDLSAKVPSMSEHEITTEVETLTRKITAHKVALSAYVSRRNDLIRSLHDDYHWSERKIAKLAGVSPAFINEVRRKLKR